MRRGKGEERESAAGEGGGGFNDVPAAAAAGAEPLCLREAVVSMATMPANEVARWEAGRPVAVGDVAVSSSSLRE